MYNKFKKKKKVKKMFQFMFTNKNLFILILIKKMMDKMSKKNLIVAHLIIIIGISQTKNYFENYK